MINSDNLLRLRILSISVVLMFSLMACNDDTDTISHDGKNLNLNLSLPEVLSSPPIPDLRAYVTLNGGMRTELNVNASDNTTSGQIPNVAVGAYQLRLVYFKVIAQEEIMLATFTKSITVNKGQTTTVTVSSDQLDRDIDTDGDGYTNLAEVLLGTDPRIKSDSPGVPLGFAVAHGSFGNTTASDYSMKSIAGESLVGAAASTNYQVFAGFTSY